MAGESLTSIGSGVMYGVACEPPSSEGFPKETSDAIGEQEPGARHRADGAVQETDRTCEVVKTDEGLRYRLDDGTEHKSPSSAGKAAMGGVACNGWRFWSLQGTEKPARAPKAAARRKAAAKAAPKGKKPVKGSKAKAAKKPKAARMAAKGDAYGCGACPQTFATMKAATQHALTHTAS